MSDQIREALAGMLVIVDESRGVDGYHLNGDTAEWDEFPEVEAARAALAQQPAPAAPVAQDPAAYRVRNPRTAKVKYYGAAKRYLAEQWARSGYEVTPLYTAPPATEQAPRELFTCIGKGGRYELLGESSGAGGCRREGRVIYRCLDTGQLYHRTDDDFAARMAPLTEDGEA